MKIEGPRIPDGTIKEAGEVNRELDARADAARSGSGGATKSEIAGEVIKELPSKPLRISEMTKDDAIWFSALGRDGIRVLKDGWVEISRGAGAERIWQRADGINSAIRMQEHILSQYGAQAEKKEGEAAQLESIQEAVEKANDILTKWKSASARDKKALQKELIEAVLSLEYCRNEFKVGAREQMEMVSDLTDTAGRENPGALAARTIAALGDLEGRMEEVRSIEPKIAMRHELLIFEKRRAQFSLRKAMRQVSDVAAHKVFRDLKVPPERSLSDHEVPILNETIGKALHHLECVYVAPYKQQADQAHFFLLGAKKLFASKESVLAHREEIGEKLADVARLLDADMEDKG